MLILKEALLIKFLLYLFRLGHRVFRDRHLNLMRLLTLRHLTGDQE